METKTLRHMLITDWALIENTPNRDRRKTQIECWQSRAERLASLEQQPSAGIIAELQSEAQRVAARHRREVLTCLARDLAVTQALGETPPPPWRRRLRRLIQVMGLPAETVQAQVESEAERVQVVFQG